MELKEMRILKDLTQLEAATYLNISLRSYKEYENNIDKRTSYKYQYFIDSLEQYDYVDEEKGILTFDSVKENVSVVLEKYDVEYCYLFGSYAKRMAKGDSDIDLLVSTAITGLQFYGLIEELREKLKKKIDLLTVKQLENNFELTKEILKTGIKIYERR